MNKKKLIFCICILVCITKISADPKIIIQDCDGKNITATFTEEGIIETINGEIGNYSCTPLTITFPENAINIKLKYCSDGCYNIKLRNMDSYVELTKIFTENKVFKKRDDLTYNINFEQGKNYLVKDDYIIIDKVSKKSIVTDATESYLPMIQYNENECIQYFGKTINDDSIGSRKYTYSPDKKSIECYKIMPGDYWENYLTATISDFKSKNQSINLINYIILYNYDYQLGAMLFPYLFDL